jgi:hypothetical protein
MAQVAKLSGIAVPVGPDNPVPHGLVRTPSAILLLHGTEANITPSMMAPDEDNIYLDNGGAGDENAEVLVWAVHSIADSDQQITVQSGVVAAGDEVAVPHTLVRAPSIVVLGFGTDANVSVGSTPPDADNFYLDNGGGGGEAYVALLMAPHSIIA